MVSLEIGPIWQYGEIIGATVIVIGVIIGFSRTWATFSVRLENVQTDISEIKKTEKENHESNRAQIETMRKERHDEITALESKLVTQIKENNNNNTSEHKIIMDVQQSMLVKITEIITELRLTKSKPRTKNEQL